MYKKLIAMVLSLALVFCTASSVFAGTADSSDSVYATVSADSITPYSTAAEGTTGKEADAVASEEVSSEELAAEDTSGSNETSAGDAATEEKTETEDTSDKDDEKSSASNKDDEEDKETAKEKAARKKAEKYRNGLAAYMRKVNPKMGKVWSRNLAQTFIDAGEKYDLDPTVLMALAQRESSFSSKATSPYGYKGIMQTSDYLAKKYGYKPSQLYDPEVSIDVAARYLASLKKTFKTYTKALSGYIYGGYAVKHGNYSKKAANQIMKTRKEIKNYLKRNDFV